MRPLGDKFGVTEAIGTGPFKLETFTVGSETVLVRNDDYKWASPLSKNAGPAKIEKLTFREIAEDSTAFLELKTGGVDMLLVGAERSPGRNEERAEARRAHHAGP